MSESSDYSSEDSQGWISWFCNLEDHQFFCQVDEDYITDNFNLYGIKQMFDHYNDALEMILSPEPPEGEELEDERFSFYYLDTLQSTRKQQTSMASFMPGLSWLPRDLPSWGRSFSKVASASVHEYSVNASTCCRSEWARKFEHHEWKYIARGVRKCTCRRRSATM